MKFLPDRVIDFFAQSFIGQNTVGSWLLLLGTLLLGFLFKTLIAKGLTRLLFRLFRRSDSTALGFEELFRLVKRPWNSFLLLITIYAAFQFVDFPKEWEMRPVSVFGIRMILDRLMLMLILGAFTWVLLRLTDFFGLLMLHRAGQTHHVTDNQLVPFLRESIKVLLCIFSFFFLLGAVFHVNVASLIAGLGIGGLAVALAAKESLENLLASVTIFLDKPFVIGDRVKVDNITGAVERIGFRSTRLRTDDHEFVTVPNKHMVDNEVFNLTLRPVRRVQQAILLGHETTAEQLQELTSSMLLFLQTPAELIPEDSRVHFFSVTNIGFEVQFTYFIRTIDPDIYLQVRQDINFAVLRMLEERQIAYAWTNPTPAIPKK